MASDEEVIEQLRFEKAQLLREKSEIEAAYEELCDYQVKQDAVVKDLQKRVNDQTRLIDHHGELSKNSEQLENDLSHAHESLDVTRKELNQVKAELERMTKLVRGQNKLGILEQRLRDRANSSSSQTDEHSRPVRRSMRGGPDRGRVGSLDASLAGLRKRFQKSNKASSSLKDVGHNQELPVMAEIQSAMEATKEKKRQEAEMESQRVKELENEMLKLKDALDEEQHRALQLEQEMKQAKLGRPLGTPDGISIGDELGMLDPVGGESLEDEFRALDSSNDNNDFSGGASLADELQSITEETETEIEQSNGLSTQDDPNQIIAELQERLAKRDQEHEMLLEQLADMPSTNADENAQDVVRLQDDNKQLKEKIFVCEQRIQYLEKCVQELRPAIRRALQDAIAADTACLQLHKEKEELEKRLPPPPKPPKPSKNILATAERRATGTQNLQRRTSQQALLRRQSTQNLLNTSPKSPSRNEARSAGLLRSNSVAWSQQRPAQRSRQLPTVRPGTRVGGGPMNIPEEASAPGKRPSFWKRLSKDS